MKLTKEQKIIVELQDSQHLVLAPPGTGKTELLVQRLSNAVKNGIDQEKMICLTFTNRAAQNMADRIEKEIGEHQIFIGNIHSYCNTYLRKEHIIPQNTSLLDEEDTRLLLRELLEETPCYVIDRYKNKSRNIYANELLTFNTFLKQKHLNFPDTLLEDPAIHFKNSEQCAVAICQQYEKIKEESNFMDFNDLLVLAYSHLNSPGTQASDIRFEWLQIDEVQDLNPLQWEIVNKISSNTDSHRVFFGDYEQAIFSFMGAKLEVLDRVSKECEMHYLSNNFRSPKYLLDIYNVYAQAWLAPKWHQAPVSKNSMEKPVNALAFKSIVTEHPTGKYGTEEDEIGWIVNKKLPREPIETTAILVKSNAVADKFSVKLDNRGVHYFKISGFDLFHRREIKDLMSFFGIIVNSEDRNSWIRNFHLYGQIKTLKESRQFVNQLFDTGFRPFDFLAKTNFQHSYLDDFLSLVEEDRVVVFDTETTGLDTDTDDIIQIAAVEIINQKIGRTFEVYIDTNKDLAESEKIHKISKEQLRKYAIDKKEALRKFLDFVGSDTLVAHNLAYDYKILNSNLRREQLGSLSESLRLYDSIEISKRLYPKLPSYKLEYLLDELNIAGQNSHNALDDVKATVNLILSFMKPIEKGREKRFSFVEGYRTILGNFRERFSPVYEAVSGNFSNEMPLHEVLSMVMNYMEGSLGYKTEEKIYAELNKLLRHMKQKCILQEVFESINQYIPEYVKYKESDLVLGNEKIIIATIHKAKGLEFENVIIPGCTDDNFPGYYSKQSGAEAILEEARLLYVAMTRAKKRLLITSHTMKVIQTRRGPWEIEQEPSRFLRPIVGLLK